MLFVTLLRVSQLVILFVIPYLLSLSLCASLSFLSSLLCIFKQRETHTLAIHILLCAQVVW